MTGRKLKKAVSGGAMAFLLIFLFQNCGSANLSGGATQDSNNQDSSGSGTSASNPAPTPTPNWFSPTPTPGNPTTGSTPVSSPGSTPTSTPAATPTPSPTPFIDGTVMTTMDYSFWGDNGPFCMDVRQSSTTAGANLVQTKCNSSASQSWHLQPTAAGYYLVSDNSSLCATVATSGNSSSGSGAQGPTLTQQACTGASGQNWTYQTISGGFELVDQNSGMCLTFPDWEFATTQQMYVSTCASNNKYQVQSW